MTELDASKHSWPDLDARLQAGTPLILPVGSFEQHGPHLPLATDAIVADALARETARRVGALVLPTLPYGAPSRPRVGGGDLFAAPSVPLATLLRTVEALADGVLDAGCRFLVVCSWHMENANVLWDALAGPARKHDTRVQLVDAPWAFLTDDLDHALFDGVRENLDRDHAGRLETALMRHLAPDLVGDPPAPVPFNARHGYDVLPTRAMLLRAPAWCSTRETSRPSSGVVASRRWSTASSPRSRSSATAAERCVDLGRNAPLHARARVAGVVALATRLALRNST